MARLDAHGFAVDPPRGWDAQIYVRPPEPPVPPAAGAPGAPAATGGAAPPATAGVNRPVVHLANFALPPGRADVGGGAVEQMGSGGVFIALLDFGPAVEGSALFAHRGPPWPLTAADFDPSNLNRLLAGQSGCQRFFTHGDRALCLYVVLGSHRQREVLVREANAALASIDLG